MKAIPITNGFITAIEASVAERQKLLGFLQYLMDENVYEKISKSPYSPAAETWRHWAANTFIGFSAEGILLKSGFGFDLSRQTNNPTFGDELRTSRVRKRLRYLKYALFPQLLEPNQPDEAGLRRTLYRFYPNLCTPTSERPLMEYAPLQYVLGREMLELMEHPHIDKLLEIGAGKGVHVVLQLMRNPQAQVTIIDLPETLFVTYLSLRQMLPKQNIYFPHENIKNGAQGSYIQLLLPSQTDLLEPNGFDAVVNMNSFQEMEIGVVNAYLELAAKHLKKGGGLHSCNQRISRHVAGNSSEKYGLEHFSDRRESVAPIHTYLASIKNGLGGGEHVYLRGVK